MNGARVFGISTDSGIALSAMATSPGRRRVRGPCSSGASGPSERLT